MTSISPPSTSLPRPVPIRKTGLPTEYMRKNKELLIPPSFKPWSPPYLPCRFRPIRPVVELTVTLNEVYKSGRGPRSGQKIVQWKKQSSPLGQGTFREVFLGKNQLTKKEVALKIYKGKVDREQERIRAAIWNRIPHVIHSHGILRLTDRTALIMDVAPKSLASYLKNNTISFRQMILLTRQLLEMHRTASHWGFVHGDLKPKNLCWDEKKEKLWVIDIGSSHQPEEEQIPTEGATIPYLDPISFLEEKYDTTRDMWSIGCILFECYTKEPFVPTDNLNMVLFDITRQIGLPPDSFVAKYPKWRKWRQSHSGGYVRPDSKPHLHRKIALLSNSLSDEQKELFSKLLTGMLKWEERIKPAAALELCDQILSTIDKGE
jgi:serine/threonine protein kinase